MNEQNAEEVINVVKSITIWGITCSADIKYRKQHVHNITMKIRSPSTNEKITTKLISQSSDVAIQVLRLSSNTRISYLLQCHPPDATSTGVEACLICREQSIDRQIADIIGIYLRKESSFERDSDGNVADPTLMKDVISLSNKFKGLGR
jgi:hypothetical protein